MYCLPLNYFCTKIYNHHKTDLKFCWTTTINIAESVIWQQMHYKAKYNIVREGKRWCERYKQNDKDKHIYRLGKVE
jgi:hypothetical protein